MADGDEIKATYLGQLANQVQSQASNSNVQNTFEQIAAVTNQMPASINNSLLTSTNLIIAQLQNIQKTVADIGKRLLITTDVIRSELVKIRESIETIFGDFFIRSKQIGNIYGAPPYIFKELTSEIERSRKQYLDMLNRQFQMERVLAVLAAAIGITTTSKPGRALSFVFGKIAAMRGIEEALEPGKRPYPFTRKLSEMLMLSSKTVIKVVPLIWSGLVKYINLSKKELSQIRAGTIEEVKTIKEEYAKMRERLSQGFRFQMSIWEAIKTIFAYIVNPTGFIMRFAKILTMLFVAKTVLTSLYNVLKPVIQTYITPVLRWIGHAIYTILPTSLQHFIDRVLAFFKQLYSENGGITKLITNTIIPAILRGVYKVIKFAITDVILPALKTVLTSSLFWKIVWRIAEIYSIAIAARLAIWYTKNTITRLGLWFFGTSAQLIGKIPIIGNIYKVITLIYQALTTQGYVTNAAEFNAKMVQYGRELRETIMSPIRGAGKAISQFALKVRNAANAVAQFISSLVGAAVGKATIPGTAAAGVGTILGGMLFKAKTFIKAVGGFLLRIITSLLGFLVTPAGWVVLGGIIVSAIIGYFASKAYGRMVRNTVQEQVKKSATIHDIAHIVVAYITEIIPHWIKHAAITAWNWIKHVLSASGGLLRMIGKGLLGVGEALLMLVTRFFIWYFKTMFNPNTWIQAGRMLKVVTVYAWHGIISAANWLFTSLINGIKYAGKGLWHGAGNLVKYIGHKLKLIVLGVADWILSIFAKIPFIGKYIKKLLQNVGLAGYAERLKKESINEYVALTKVIDKLNNSVSSFINESRKTAKILAESAKSTNQSAKKTTEAAEEIKKAAQQSKLMQWWNQISSYFKRMFGWLKNIKAQDLVNIFKQIGGYLKQFYTQSGLSHVTKGLQYIGSGIFSTIRVLLNYVSGGRNIGTQIMQRAAAYAHRMGWSGVESFFTRAATKSPQEIFSMAVAEFKLAVSRFKDTLNKYIQLRSQSLVDIADKLGINKNQLLGFIGRAKGVIGAVESGSRYSAIGEERGGFVSLGKYQFAAPYNEAFVNFLIKQVGKYGDRTTTSQVITFLNKAKNKQLTHAEIVAFRQSPGYGLLKSVLASPEVATKQEEFMNARFASYLNTIIAHTGNFDKYKALVPPGVTVLLADYIHQHGPRVNRYIGAAYSLIRQRISNNEPVSLAEIADILSNDKKWYGTRIRRVLQYITNMGLETATWSELISIPKTVIEKPITARIGKGREFTAWTGIPNKPVKAYVKTGQAISEAFRDISPITTGIEVATRNNVTNVKVHVDFGKYKHVKGEKEGSFTIVNNTNNTNVVTQQTTPQHVQNDEPSTGSYRLYRMIGPGGVR